MLKNYLHEDLLEAGCDEAGRGCLAGPVTAAAVIMPADYRNPMLNDSKKLSRKKREILRTEIENLAVDYAVAFIDNHEIDEINVLKASILGMHRALDELKIRPQFILVDGNKFYQYTDIAHSCVIKGDGKYVSIAAASILAKTYRDEYMRKLHDSFNNYGWDRNKGYPTKQHREAIGKHGITPFHRRSFQLTNSQLDLNF